MVNNVYWESKPGNIAKNGQILAIKGALALKHKDGATTTCFSIMSIPAARLEGRLFIVVIVGV